MGKHLILHERGVVEDEDLLDRERGDLSEEYAAKGIGDGGVDADEREGSVEGLELVEGDAETLEVVSISNVTRYPSAILFFYFFSLSSFATKSIEIQDLGTCLNLSMLHELSSPG